jgi:hypothetical protein
MALLIADELSNEPNHVAEKHRVQELKNEALRLMEQEEVHGSKT